MEKRNIRITIINDVSDEVSNNERYNRVHSSLSDSVDDKQTSPNLHTPNSYSPNAYRYSRFRKRRSPCYRKHSEKWVNSIRNIIPSNIKNVQLNDKTIETIDIKSNKVIDNIIDIEEPIRRKDLPDIVCNVINDVFNLVHDDAKFTDENIRKEVEIRGENIRKQLLSKFIKLSRMPELSSYKRSMIMYDERNKILEVIHNDINSDMEIEKQNEKYFVKNTRLNFDITINIKLLYILKAVMKKQISLEMYEWWKEPKNCCPLILRSIITDQLMNI